MSKIIFAQYSKEVIKPNTAYFFKVGVYNSVEELNEATFKFNNYIYIEEKNKYYVYVAITKNNKEKVKSYLDSINIKTDVEKKEVGNSFLKYLKDNDSKMDDNNIKDIVNDSLRKYEELNDKD